MINRIDSEGQVESKRTKILKKGKKERRKLEQKGTGKEEERRKERKKQRITNTNTQQSPF